MKLDYGREIRVHASSLGRSFAQLRAMVEDPGLNGPNEHSFNALVDLTNKIRHAGGLGVEVLERETSHKQNWLKDMEWRIALFFVFVFVIPVFVASRTLKLKS